MTPAHVPFAPIAALMFMTGIGIPIMATFNSQLGQQIGSPPAATFILFVLGAVVATAVLLATGSRPDPARMTMDRPYIYFGAVFMFAYILSITWAAPRIGVGNAIFFVLLGQLVAAAAIDHFGLWGAMTASITPRRLAGIAVMALGVYLARKPV